MADWIDVETARERGPAQIWKAGRLVGTGFLEAVIEREVRVAADGSRTHGAIEYRAVLTTLTAVVEGPGFEVLACGRRIPCSIFDGEVHPSDAIRPAPRLPGGDGSASR